MNSVLQSSGVRDEVSKDDVLSVPSVSNRCVAVSSVY